MSFEAFDISASGLHSQRMKMDTISSNIANINTTRDANGKLNPYVRKDVIFSATYEDVLNRPGFPQGGVRPSYSSYSDNMMLKGSISFDSPSTSNGVQVEQIKEAKDPYKLVYEPGHPDANEDGFVKMPNINIVTEMVDMMKANRAYEANVSAIEAAKTMVSSAMKI